MPSVSIAPSSAAQPVCATRNMALESKCTLNPAPCCGCKHLRVFFCAPVAMHESVHSAPLPIISQKDVFNV